MGYDDVVGTGGRATSAVDQKGAVTLSPQRPIVGEAVTATLEDSDGSVSVQAWEWERSPYGTESELVWTAINGAQTNSYTPVASDDSGKLIPVSQ